jgi:hypothetical protein
MIEMEMTKPNGIKVGPVKLLFGHAMWSIGAKVQHESSTFRFQPESGGCSLLMWNRSA